MSAEQTNCVDMVTLDHVSGLIRLKLIDDLRWDAAHLITLQNRINHCLQFIESGAIYLDYPQAQERDFAIDIQCIYAPGQAALTFLQHAQQLLDTAGYTLNWAPLGSVYADDAEHALNERTSN